MKKNVVIIASGAGLGNHIGKEFGSHDFRVFLVARNKKKLKEYVHEFRDCNIETYYKIADCSIPDTLTYAIQEIQNEYGIIDVLVYNAALLQTKKPSELTEKDLMKSYQIDVASALHCVNLVLDEQLKHKNGTILFTGGGLGINPCYEFSTISIGKSALRSLALCLNQEYSKKGIYVGIVNIFGNIEKNTAYDPANIAKKYYQLYLDRNKPEINI